MTTPTAKELFLAAWQAQLSHVVPEPAYADFTEADDADHSWQPFSVGEKNHWLKVWGECSQLARAIARVEAEEK